jgi:hypothetical protein
MMSLKDAKNQYKGKWIAFFIKEERNGNTYGEVLDSDADKTQLHERLREKKVKEVYVTFAGPYIKAGYEVMF